MHERIFGGMLLAFLLASAIVTALGVQRITASDEPSLIYIRADGSIEPDTVPIQRDGDLYALTGDITDYDGIVVERDNMILDGARHLFDGCERTFQDGVTLEGRENVTIKNMTMRRFGGRCIYLNFSSNNFILANDMASVSRYGGDLMLESSSNNLISGNNITDSYQYYDGICLSSSSNSNSIVGNNIRGHDQSGVGLYSSSNNTIFGNNITNNAYGISLDSSCDNSVYHNNFVDNTQQAASGSTSIWDNGREGNYWSDYNGTDLDEDGIGEPPYIIDINNRDNYPLMRPWNGSTWTDRSIDQDKAFESGLNYLSASNRFYQNKSVTSNDFVFFKNHSITHLSIRIYWKSFVEDYVNLIANYHRLLDLTDYYGMKVQFDFWTSFSNNVMPQGLMPFDLIRNDTVKGLWLDFVRNVTNEFKSHASIESWTMMNEPRVESGHEATDKELFYQCWTEQREIMKGIDPRNLTIRFALGNSPWSGDFNSTEVFQVCDCIAINEYLDPGNSNDTQYGGNWTTFNDCVSECQNMQVPLVISEFGMNTSTLEDRGEYYSQSLSLFKNKGIRKAYAFAWQTIYPENESFNIYGIDPPTPAFLALARASTITVPDDYATIQEAIDNANEGGTVFVRNGTYYEHVVVNKTLSLIGESIDGTVLNSTDTDPFMPIMIIEADNVKMRGFTFEGWSLNNIYINAATGVVIVENRIVFNAMGILVENSVNITIENNVIVGFGLDNIGIMLDHSTECRITNNRITNAVYDGVRLWFSDNNLLSHNLVTNNDFGMFLHGSNGNTVSENTVSESGGPGMYFEEGSSNNVIVHNNFIDNWTPVGFWDSSANTWDNGCEGNYWSDYNGTDSDGDGVGETPYVIDSHNTDHYPLMNRYWILADVNHDLKIDILDVVRITAAYGTEPSSPEWNPHADIAAPFGKIDILDVVKCTSHYGRKWL